MYFPPETDRQFLVVSAALTGFGEVDLQATGVAEELWNTLVGVVGSAIAGEFLSACEQAVRQSAAPEELEAELARLVMVHPKFGPLARNLITLWYLGQWNALPREWCDAYGSSEADVARVVSSQAYLQGLVWPAFGAHPMGGLPPGFGSWAEPPLRRPSL
jgi:hypothetical protein